MPYSLCGLRGRHVGCPNICVRTCVLHVGVTDTVLAIEVSMGAVIGAVWVVAVSMRDMQPQRWMLQSLCEIQDPLTITPTGKDKDEEQELRTEKKTKVPDSAAVKH